MWQNGKFTTCLKRDARYTFEAKAFLTFVSEMILHVSAWPPLPRMAGGFAHMIGDTKWRDIMDMAANPVVTKMAAEIAANDSEAKTTTSLIT